MTVTDFPWNPDDPLARVPKSTDRAGETTKAHQSLIHYWELGPGRSLAKLVVGYQSQPKDSPKQPPTRMLSTLKGWSVRHCWQARVARRVELWRLEMDEALREHRLTVLEQDWEHGQRLRSLAGEILDAAPAFVRRKSKRGKPQVIVDGVVTEPGEPTVTTLALDSVALHRIEKLASEMTRLASEMETERAGAKVDVTSGGKPIVFEVKGIDLEKDI